MKLHVLIAALATAMFPFTLAGQAIGPDDFRISSMGVDGVGSFRAERPSVAYNPVDDEYLVVWSGRDSDHADGEFEIFAQRIDAKTGASLGTDDLRISAMGGFPVTGTRARAPSIAYAPPPVHEYLVVWDGEEQGVSLGLFGQRIDAATGQEVGPDDFVVEAGRLFGSDLLYDAVQQSYLVAWVGRGVPPQNGIESEIFARRLDATGLPLSDSRRISAMGGVGSDQRFAQEPAIAHDPGLGRYFVVWSGDGGVESELEIYGQMLLADTLQEIGPPDRRISFVGDDGDTLPFAVTPAVVFRNIPGRAVHYLVTYSVNERGGGLLDREVYGRRLDPEFGSSLDSDDVPITGVSGDDSTEQADLPTLLPTSHDWLLVWRDPVTETARAAQVGLDLRTLGDPIHLGDVLSGEDLLAPTVAGSGGRFLAVWDGVELAPQTGSAEREIYGQHFRTPSVFADDFEFGVLTAWSLVVNGG